MPIERKTVLLTVINRKAVTATAGLQKEIWVQRTIKKVSKLLGEPSIMTVIRQQKLYRKAS